MPSQSAIRGLAAFAACLLSSFFPSIASAQNTDAIVVTARHAPAINGEGRVEGSVRMLLGESFVLNGGGAITGDLLTPGTPNLQINGTPTFGGVVEGTGITVPSNYSVTLNTGSTLRFLRTRTDPTPLPKVAKSSPSTGTRNVILSSSNDQPGDWATVRDLTIHGQAGVVSLPPGNYRNLTANGITSIRIGIAGASAPSTYSLQSLTLNGQSRLVVVGPVILSVNSGINFNGVTGDADHPEWLQLRISAGGATLNGGAILYATILAPNGTVFLNGDAALYGSVTCDRLRLNGNGLISWRDTSVGGNRSPIANSDSESTQEDHSVAITLTGSDPDGNALAFAVVVPPSNGTLSGTGANRTYTPNSDFHGADSFTFTAGDGQAVSAPATFTINVTPVNDAPVPNSHPVVVTEDTPTIIKLTASDIDGDLLTFTAPSTTSRGTLEKYVGLDAGPGDFLYTPNNNNTLPDNFTFAVNDGQGGGAEAEIPITIIPIADRPVVASLPLVVNEDGELNITLTGVDPDGEPLIFEIQDGSGPAHGTLTSDNSVIKYRPTEDYTGPDSFNYIARDSQGLESLPATISIQVLPIDDAPVAHGGVVDLDEDQPYSFTLQGADVEAEPLTFVILQSAKHGVITGVGPTFVYTPLANFHGDDSFTFIVVDRDDPDAVSSTPATILLRVASKNDAPVAQTGVVSTSEDNAVRIVLDAIDDDGDPLTYITPRPPEDAISFGPQHGTLIPTEDPRIWIYNPNANFNGTDFFTFRVLDPEGLISDAVVHIAVGPIDDAPVAMAIPVTVPEDESVGITLSGIDVDDLELTFVVAAGTGPIHGSLGGTPPTLIYQPNADFAQVDSFEYFAQDSFGLTSNLAPVTITVVPKNDAPVGQNLSVNTQEDTAILIDLAASDVENDPVTFLVPTAPSYGNLTYVSPSRYRYEPFPDFNGVDTFSFKVSDGEAISAPAVVTIQVEKRNDAPVATALSIQTWEDTAVAFTLSGADVDGDLLAILQPSTPQNGNLTRDVNDPTRFSYTPNNNFNGTDTFSFAVHDGQISSVVVVVTITVSPVNDAPIAIAGNNINVTAPQMLDLAGTAADDGESASSILHFQWTKISGPGIVTFANSEAGVTTAAYTRAGDYVLRLSVSDGELTGWDDLEVNIAMPNRAPVVAAGADQSINEGALVQLSGVVNDDGLPANSVLTLQWLKVSGPGSPSFSNASAAATSVAFDLPGQYILRLRAADGEYIAQDHVAISVSPANLPPTVNAGPDREIVAGGTVRLSGAVSDDGKPRGNGLNTSWTKVSGPGFASFSSQSAISTTSVFSAPGTYVLRLTASDGALTGADDTNVVVHATSNSAPTVQAGPDQTLSVFGTARLTGSAQDDGLPAASELAYAWTAVNGPGLATFVDPTAASTQVTFDVAGTYTFMLTVTDGELSGSDEIVVQVGIQNKAPVVKAGFDQSVTPGGIVTLSGEVADDGLPAGQLVALTWSKVSGPGNVTFGEMTARTNATFSEVGDYILRLTANDSELSGNDEMKVSVICTPLQAPVGLVGLWRGQENTRDAIGYRQGDPRNGLAYRLGKVGRAFQFDGADDHLIVPAIAPLAGDAPSLDLGKGSGFTIEAWINPSTLGHRPIFEWSGPQRGVQLYSSLSGSSKLYANIVDTAGASHEFSASSVFTNVNVWQHVALTFNKATGKAILYRNGVVVGQATYSNITPRTTGDLYVGRSSIYYFAGGIDEPSLYNRDLTAGEILAIYQVGGCGKTDGTTEGFPSISVDAGLDRSNPLFRPLDLMGNVRDRRLEYSSDLELEWSKVSGPGDVHFSSTNASSASVQFSSLGRYTLRFQATDGSYTAVDEIVIDITESAYERRIALQSGNGTAQDPLNRYSTNGGATWLPATITGHPDYDVIPGTSWIIGQYVEGGSRRVRARFVLPDDFTNPSLTLLIHCDNGLKVYLNGAEVGRVSIGTNSAGQEVGINSSNTFHNPEEPIFTSNASLFQVGENILEFEIFNTFGPMGLDYQGFVTFISAPVAGNTAPQVDAGPNQTIAIPNNAIMAAVLTNDGLPLPDLTRLTWEKLRGPGTVVFGNPTLATTNATFSMPGEYLLRISADDGEFTSRDTVTVTVVAPIIGTNQAPTVEAGADFGGPTLSGVPITALVIDDGQLLGLPDLIWTKVSGPGDVAFSVHSNAETKIAVSSAGEYVLALTAFDGQYSRTDTVTYHASGTTVVNIAPVSQAGLDQTVQLPNAVAQLSGSITDDGLPSNFPRLGYWEAIAPIASVELANAENNVAHARFTAAGDYTFRFTVSDGLATASDEVIIHVLPRPEPDLLNVAPVVSAGFDQTLPGLGPVLLNGESTDDGRPGPTLVNQWSKISGPGAVLFGSASAVETTALFNAPGTYILRLTSSDGLLSAFDEVTIVAGTGGNQPPVVLAGDDLAIPYGQKATLNPVMTDDGAPNGILSAYWSVVGASGPVKFEGDLEQLNVTFGKLGTYILRLTVSDGAFTSSDEVIIEVTGSNLPPPSVVLTSPAAGTSNSSGQPVFLAAEAIQPASSVDFVEFYVGAALVGRDSSVPYEASWTPVSSGTHSLTAVATDILGVRGTSIPVAITINAAIPDVAITYPPSGAAFAPADIVNLRATTYVVSGNAPVSHVEFLVNSTVVGNDTTAPYSSAWAIPDGMASYIVTARATDAAGQVVTSAPVMIRSIADPNATPVVVIGNLQGGESITEPRAIVGTVEMPSLREYRLEYRRKGAECMNWVVFASGSGSVQNGTLGNFDPTVLLNGLYEIRLVATSAYGSQFVDQTTISVEGGMKVGLFTVAFNDLELPLAGVPITVTRIYDSREHCPGDFGHGWNLDVETIRLDLNAPVGAGWNLDVTDGTLTAPPIYQLTDTVAHMASVRMPDGEILRFSPKLVFARDYNRLASVLDADGDDVAQAWNPIGNSTPLRLVYRPRGGTQGATLIPRGYRASGLEGGEEVPGNATFYPNDPYGGELLLATEDNTTLNAPLVGNVTGWELRLKDGRAFLFDDQGRLEQMIDSVGNMLTIVRDGGGRVQRVSHSSGQQIDFVRNGQGFVTEIADPKGAKLTYQYDSDGDLRAFYDRVTPLDSPNPTQRFSYKPGTHYLEDLFDGKGVRASRSYYDSKGRLVRTVDAEGREINFTHDVAGRTETIRDRSNRTTIHRYDERGNVVQTVQPDNTIEGMTYHVWSDGRKSELKSSESITGLFTDETGVLVQKTLTTLYAYEDDDASTPPVNDGLLRKVTDPLGHSSTFSYDDRGNMLTVTDALNRTTVNTYYPGTTLLASTTDPLNHVTSFTYDGRGHLDKETKRVTLIDETGASIIQTLVTDFDYDARGRLTKLTNAANHATHYTYDENGNQLTSTTTRTDETGAIRTLLSENEYDSENRLVKSWDAPHPRAGGHSPASETIFDENGKPSISYDAERRPTRMFYTARGELFRTENADQTSESTYYDPEGRREFHDDRRGKRSQFVYDVNGRLAETWFLGSAGDIPVRLSATIYDAADRVYQSTDARHQTTTFVYDAAGRRTATIDALGHRTDFFYDRVGNLHYFRDAKHNTIEHIYDSLNRRVRTIFPPSPVAESPNAPERSVATETITVYDAISRRVAEYEQSPLDIPVGSRRSTRFVYDELSRLRAVVQPEVDGTTPVTRYTYDEIGNQITQTDAKNRTTYYAYDDLGRRIGRQLPGGQSETVNFYRTGPVRERLDFNGTLTIHLYDSMNRLLQRTSDHSQASRSNVSFTYTASGRRWTMTDATGTTIYGYDHRDRLKTKATPQGTITYEYEDASGLLTGMHTDTPNGADATYTYDELSRLETVSDVNAQTTAYEYDANGNLENVILPNGVTSTYGYSATNRLQSLSVQKTGTNLAHFAYALAPSGHRHRATETGAALQPGNPNGTRSRVWQYDSLWRLRNETLGGGGALGNGQFLPNGSVGYTLDSVGNRANRTSTIAGLASQSFTYDENDRVQGDLSDANGNTLSGNASQSRSSGTHGQDAYDAENRLIARTGTIGQIPSSIAVLYDGDGHKVSETITQNGSPTTTSHLVDDLNPTGYAQVIEEKVNGALTRVYLFGHDLISQDIAAQSGDPWQLVYFCYDGHGSTRFLTNSAGAVTDSYEYDAFGEILAYSGTTPNRYRYCGEQFSEALGLYYLRARLMNPLTGRFWTMDSWEGNYFVPQARHKFSYVHNNPTNLHDSSGHDIDDRDFLVDGWLVHQSIGRHFVSGASPGDRLANFVPISGILNRTATSFEKAMFTTLDGFGLLSLKPDLIDLATREIWEIKTTRGYWQGQMQLSVYLAILNGFSPPLSPRWRAGDSYSPPDKAKGLLRDATVYSSTNGVITYEPFITDDTLAVGAMTVGTAILSKLTVDIAMASLRTQLGVAAMRKGL